MRRDQFKQLMFGTLFSGSPWRIMKAVLFIIIMSYVGLAVFLFFFQTNLIYLPSSQITQTPEDYGLDYQELWLPTGERNEKVHAWSIPAAEANDSGRWVLFCHGNAGNIGGRLTMAKILRNMGFSTLLFDYRGFGRSEGRPSEQNTYEDSLAAWRWLTEEQRVQPREIMIFGRSLGGAVAAWLAREKNPGLLIVESTFTSIPEMGQQLYPYFPVRWLVRHHYPVRKFLADYDGPLLIMHSRDDEIVPMEMGRELYEIAPGEKQFFQLRGGHNEVWYVMGDEYEDILRQGIENLWPPAGDR